MHLFSRHPTNSPCALPCSALLFSFQAYVELLEYDNIEGMILLSELSRRRIRSINKLIRVDRNECVVVLRVDKEKVTGDRVGVGVMQ